MGRGEKMSEIKNVVFDMGNVLLDYDPEVSLRRFVEKKEDRDWIRRELFEGPEWIAGDRGEITNSQKFDGVSKRVPERLHAALRQCVEHWDICMHPIEGALEFVEQVKDRGYRIYVLSNASDNFYDYFLNFRPLEYFDGILVSADVHLLKPQKEIYTYFLEKFSLNAQECLFIDDRADNVEGARISGMNAWHFRGDYEKIWNILK